MIGDTSTTKLITDSLGNQKNNLDKGVSIRSLNITQRISP